MRWGLGCVTWSVYWQLQILKVLQARPCRPKYCTHSDLRKAKPCLKGLHDERQCDTVRICYKRRWSHPRGKHQLSVPPPTRNVVFIIHHLDKLFLIRTPICPPRPLLPSLSCLGKFEKRRRRSAFNVRVIFLLWFLSDKCVCSFVSGSILNQEKAETQETFWRSLLIRKSILLTFSPAFRVTKDGQRQKKRI